MPRADLVSRSCVLSKLRSRLATNQRDRFIPEEPQRDYRVGHIDAREDEARFLRALIAELEAARTVGGLRELRDTVTELQPGVLFEATSVWAGEGG